MLRLEVGCIVVALDTGYKRDFDGVKIDHHLNHILVKETSSPKTGRSTHLINIAYAHYRVEWRLRYHFVNMWSFVWIFFE